MAYADGELDGDDEARVKAILEGSAEARELLASFGAIGDGVRSSVDAPEGIDVADVVMARVVPNELDHARLKRIARTRMTVVGASLLAVAAAVVLYVNQTGEAPTAKDEPQTKPPGDARAVRHGPGSRTAGPVDRARCTGRQRRYGNAGFRLLRSLERGRERKWSERRRVDRRSVSGRQVEQHGPSSSSLRRTARPLGRRAPRGGRAERARPAAHRRADRAGGEGHRRADGAPRHADAGARLHRSADRQPAAAEEAAVFGLQHLQAPRQEGPPAREGQAGHLHDGEQARAPGHPAGRDAPTAATGSPRPSTIRAAARSSSSSK